VSAADGESFLTVAEVAEQLRLNQHTIRNWIDRGELPAVRIGRRVRIRRRDLDHLLAHRTSHTVKAVRGAGAASTTEPPELWERLGAAATALGEAISTAQRAAIAAALSELGDAAHELGDTLAHER
jgi:excisionase family DNA binding protein